MKGEKQYIFTLDTRSLNCCVKETRSLSVLDRDSLSVKGEWQITGEGIPVEWFKDTRW